MAQYVIPSFSKGLVDEASQAKLDKTYKEKCSELKNFFIAADNTLQRRPPLVQPDKYREATNAVFFLDSEDRRLFVCNVAPEELDSLPNAVKNLLYPTTDTNADLSSLGYRQTPEGLRATATTTYTHNNDAYDVNWTLKANLQRLVVYEKDTDKYLPEESYLFVAVYHDTAIQVDGETLTLCALRARDEDSAYPRRIKASGIQEPAAYMIYRNNQRVASAHTMPYKHDSGISTQLKNEQDARYNTSDLLKKIDNGQEEFIFMNKNHCTAPIKEIYKHSVRGAVIPFVGLFYTWVDGRVSAPWGARLFPNVDDLSTENLKALIPAQDFSPAVSLPARVLFVPGTARGRFNREDYPYAKDNLREALTSSSPRPYGPDKTATEVLIEEGLLAGFTYQEFKSGFPELGQILNRLKTVVSVNRTADGAMWAFPNIQLLEDNSDVNKLGTAYVLGNGLFAVQTSSVRQHYWEEGEPPDINSFPNGNGYAANGVGVVLTIYRAVDQAPLGHLYLYLDYDASEVQEYFNDIDVITGISANKVNYVPQAVKVASPAAYTTQGRSFVDSLVNSAELYIGSGGVPNLPLGNTPTKAAFLDDTAVPPTTLSAAAFPFSVDTEEVKHFATPCYPQYTSNDAVLFDGRRATQFTVPVDGGRLPIPRYFHRPKFYRGIDFRYTALPGRASLHSGNRLFLSQIQEPTLFNNYVVDYFSSIANTTRNTLVLEQSDLANQIVTPLPGDPVRFDFETPDGGNDPVVAISNADVQNLYVGTENMVRRFLPSQFLSNPAVSETAYVGVSSPFISESSYNIAAAGNKLIVMRYYQEAQGVISDTLAPETTLFRGATGVAQLMGKHKVSLFYTAGSNQAYCVAMDKERTFKGLSLFEFPRPVQLMRRINPDTLGVLLDNGAYCELNFGVTDSTVYEDKVGTQSSSYESAVTSLPIVFVGDTSFSTSRTINVTKASIGVAGYLDLEMTLRDTLTGVEHKTPVRYVDRDNVGEAKKFGGFWTLENLPPNGAVATTLRLATRNNKPLALSSVVIEVN